MHATSCTPAWEAPTDKRVTPTSRILCSMLLLLGRRSQRSTSNTSCFFVGGSHPPALPTNSQETLGDASYLSWRGTSNYATCACAGDENKWPLLDSLGFYILALRLFNAGTSGNNCHWLKLTIADGQSLSRGHTSCYQRIVISS